MIADVKVQHLYLNAILDKEFQLKIEALPEYLDSDALDNLKLVETVHDAANPWFVKRSNFYAAHRAGGEAGSAYIARVRVLADLARIIDMDHKEHVKFKVLKDLPVKIREKVLKDQDMRLDEMSILVADVEAMDIINNSLKSEQPMLPLGKGQNSKEDTIPAQEVKPGKLLKPKKKTEERPDDAYKMGCWICGGEHRRDVCNEDKSCMLYNICGKENNHVTAVCLQQLAGSTPAGQPAGRPATPGLQSGMVAMEEKRVKKRSYA